MTSRVVLLHATGGYKGYGLAMMVEILCAVMGGANFGTNVRPYKTREKLHNIVSGVLVYVHVFRVAHINGHVKIARHLYTSSEIRIHNVICCVSGTVFHRC